MKKGLLKMITLLTAISMLMPAAIAFAESGSTTVTLAPVADTWTGGSSTQFNTSYGENDLLLIQSAAKNGSLSEIEYYSHGLTYLRFQLPDYIEQKKKIASAKLNMYGGGYGNNMTDRTTCTVSKIQFFKVPEAYESWDETMCRGKNSVYPFGTWGEDAWAQSGDTRSTSGSGKYPLVNVDGSATAVEKGYPLPDAELSGTFTFPEDAHRLFTFDITDMINSYSIENNRDISFFMMAFPSAQYKWLGFTSKEGGAKNNSVLGNGPELELVLEDVNGLAVTAGPSGDVRYKDDITVTFNNHLDPESVSSDSVKLYCDGEPVEDYNVTVDANTLTVSGEKVPYSDYTVECTTGIKDLYNQTLSRPQSYEFKTTMSQTTESWKHERNTDSALLQMHSAVLSYYTSGSSNVNSTRQDPENESYAGQDILANGTSGNTASRSNVFTELDLTKILQTIDDPSLINNITLYMMGSGDIDWLLRAIPNDIEFDVTTVTYSKMTELLKAESPSALLPSLEEIGSIKQNTTAWPYIAFDLTAYAKQRIAEGAVGDKYLVRFAIQSRGSEASQIRTERTWTSSFPYLEITMDETAVTAVRLSKPSNMAASFPIGNNIEVEMSADIQATGVNADNVILQKADGSNEIVDAQIDYNPYTRTITVDPAADLEPLTPYRLTVQNLQTADGTAMARAKTISFITGGIIDYTLLESSGSLTSGSTISASTTLTNNSSNDAHSYVLILALYDGARMVNAAIVGANANETVAANGGEKELTASLAVPEAEGDYSAKAFLWNDLEQQRPLGDFIELK